MSNHTPGPWNPSFGKIIAANAIEVCSMPSRDSANAALISAAPDLLYSLKFLLADYQAIGGAMRTGSTIPSDYAEAAIKKAEGVK